MSTIVQHWVKLINSGMAGIGGRGGGGGGFTHDVFGWGCAARS